MRRWHPVTDVIEQFCGFMSRSHGLGRIGDFVGDLILSPGVQTALAGSGAVPRMPRSRAWTTVHMAIGPMPENNHGAAPASPGEANQDTVINDTGDRPGWWSWIWHNSREHNRAKREWDEKHTIHGCMEAQYHGMHGRPCKFEGGSDTKCPTGTTSGWYWSYDCPGVGKVYYVDCCGDRPLNKTVWCNWTNEANWCLFYGRAALQTPAPTRYVCTLAILDRDMRTQAVPGGYEVVGVDP
jgi:hypothetical protein